MTIPVPCPAAAAAAAVERALVSMGAQIVSRASDATAFTARTAASIWSFGELITVRIATGVPDSCEVHVSSSVDQLIDWGRNGQNLQRFAQALHVGLSSAAPVPAPSRANRPSPEPPTPPQRPDARGNSAHRVFVSYRRDDSAVMVGRICDRLARDLGESRVFKDVDNIPFGVDFVDHLDHEVERCTVLFAVIGPRWLEATPSGARRIDDPHDFVRIEIASALRRGIPVVPLLVDGAAMPRGDDLPDELQPLARRQGIAIRHDPDFHTDMSRLLSRLG